MATVYSANYSTGTYTYTRVRVDYSGTNATATLLYTRTNNYYDPTSATYATFTFGGASVGFDKTLYGPQTDTVIASVNFTISTSGGTYSGSTSGAGLFSFSGSVNIPAQSTAPNKPTVSAVVTSATSINVTYGTTSFGVPSTGTVTLYGGTSPSPTTMIASKSTTGNSTFSYTGLDPNTTYYFRAKANNGQLDSSYSTEVSATTLNDHAIYGSVNGEAKKIAKMYGSVRYLSAISGTQVALHNIAYFNRLTFRNKLLDIHPEFAFLDSGETPPRFDRLSVTIARHLTTSYHDLNITLAVNSTTLPLVVATNATTQYVKNVLGQWGLSPNNTIINGYTDVISLSATYVNYQKEITKMYASVNGVAKRIF